MVANAWLRPGNTAACSNFVEFMRETFDEVQQVGAGAGRERLLRR